tara:strand:- start:16977 stop:19232 length:2256 start_codon:yes stop_codon:yes gene_type:complete
MKTLRKRNITQKNRKINKKSKRQYRQKRKTQKGGFFKGTIGSTRRENQNPLLEIFHEVNSAYNKHDKPDNKKVKEEKIEKIKKVFEKYIDGTYDVDYLYEFVNIYDYLANLTEIEGFIKDVAKSIGVPVPESVIKKSIGVEVEEEEKEDVIAGGEAPTTDTSVTTTYGTVVIPDQKSVDSRVKSIEGSDIKRPVKANEDEELNQDSPLLSPDEYKALINAVRGYYILITQTSYLHQIFFTYNDKNKWVEKEYDDIGKIRKILELIGDFNEKFLQADDNKYLEVLTKRKDYNKFDQTILELLDSIGKNTKIRFTRHGPSCNNITWELNKTMEPLVTDGGIRRLIEFKQKDIMDPSPSFKSSYVYVSCLIRTWVTSVILYGLIPKTQNQVDALHLCISPFLKEHYQYGFQTGNFPATIEQQLEKFKQFLNFFIKQSLGGLKVIKNIKLHFPFINPDDKKSSFKIVEYTLQGDAWDRDTTTINTVKVQGRIRGYNEEDLSNFDYYGFKKFVRSNVSTLTKLQIQYAGISSVFISPDPKKLLNNLNFYNPVHYAVDGRVEQFLFWISFFKSILKKNKFLSENDNNIHVVGHSNLMRTALKSIDRNNGIINPDKPISEDEMKRSLFQRVTNNQQLKNYKKLGNNAVDPKARESLKNEYNKLKAETISEMNSWSLVIESNDEKLDVNTKPGIPKKINNSWSLVIESEGKKLHVNTEPGIPKKIKCEKGQPDCVPDPKWEESEMCKGRGIQRINPFRK